MPALTNPFRPGAPASARNPSPRRPRRPLVVEHLEQRQLLSASWVIDTDRTLQVTTDDVSNSLTFRTFDQVNLNLWASDDSGLPQSQYLIPFSSFDRINVRMGAAPDYNYAAWVDEFENCGSLASKPADIDLGGATGARNIMFLYTSGAATVSGDGQTGATFNHGDVSQRTTVNYQNAKITYMIGDVGPDHFDASAFTGHNLGLGGGGGNDTLIGGNSEPVYGVTGKQITGGDGDDIIQETGGQNEVYGGPGNDTFIGGPGNAGFQGGDGDDTFIRGTGREGFNGGPGNDSAYAVATDGPDAIVVGTWEGSNDTYVLVGKTDYWSSAFYADAENLYLNAGAGVDDGVTPTTAHTPYPDLLIAGIDPNLNLRITHLEPTVDAGPDAGPLTGGAFAATGSFRDIGDPANAWTATVNYGDGSGEQSLSVNPGAILTPSGPLHSFNFDHNYRAGGSYTVTVTIVDSEGDVGTDTLTANIASVLSVDWTIDSNRTLLITSDDHDRTVRLGTRNEIDLELWDGSVTDYIPLSSFDRIDVRMGAGHVNYVNWVEGYSDWGPLSKPANIDLGNGIGAENVVFFITGGTASLSGDGRTAAQFHHVDASQPSSVTYKNAGTTQLWGGEGPDHFDGSAFTGSNMVLSGGGGADTLTGGTGGTVYFCGEGDDVVRQTGGQDGIYGGPGNDTFIGGPGAAAFQGEEGDDVFIFGAGREGFDGGPGNDTAYAIATDGPDAIVTGDWTGTNATYTFFAASTDNYFSARAENLNIDAGSGVDDGIIPATSGTPYPFLAMAGIDPNLNLRITHLEPTVDAGPDTGPLSGGAFAASGSFRDIGDPTNTWTSTVDYGDGTGTHPLQINAGGIATPNGPARTFDLDHEYLAAGTYTVTVSVTDAEGNRGVDTRTVNVAPPPNAAPTVSKSSTSVMADEGQTATLTGSYGDVNAGDNVSLTASEGTVTKTGTNGGTWSWSKLATDDQAAHDVTITADDGYGGIATTVFRLTVNNIVPAANPDSYAIPFATALSGNVITGTGADTDPAGPLDPLTVISNSQPANGTLVMAANGAFTYTPASTFSGVDTFTYTISDGDGGTAAATVTLTVAAAPGGISTIPDTCQGGTALLVVGTAGNDTIHISPGSTSATLQVTVNGVTTTQPRPSGRVIVFAGSGDDNVQVAGSIANSVWLYGDSGNDRLDAGNEAAHGNLLIGGDGNDDLLGGNGRDVMIGGQGADKIVGNANDDVLMAGYTTRDRRGDAGHDEFWCDVLVEWSSGHTFQNRVHNLKNDGASTQGAYNGGSYLNAATLRDDTSVDQIDLLNGSSGNDWFIYQFGEDKVVGESATEQLLDTDSLS